MVILNLDAIKCCDNIGLVVKHGWHSLDCQDKSRSLSLTFAYKTKDMDKYHWAELQGSDETELIMAFLEGNVTYDE